MHGKWVAYHDGGSWRSIDARFRNDGSAFVSDYGPLRFAVPQFANETATLEINNQWDIWSKSLITSPAMVFEVTPEGVLPNIAGRIDDDQPSQVWYDDAWGPGLSLRYTVWHGRAPRATREAVVDPLRLDASARGRDLQASWLVRSSNALTLINGARPQNPDGSDWAGVAGDTATLPEAGAAIHRFDGQVDPVRGSGFKGPQVWYWKADGTLVSQSATVTATIVDADTIRLTKTIPASLVDAASAEGSLLITDDVQTIYPDPHAEVTSCDGFMRRSIVYTTYEHYGGATTWGDLIAAAGTEVSDSGATQKLQHAYGGISDFYLSRLLFGFDMSALSGTVTAADFNFYQASSGSYWARLSGASPASNTAIAIADHQDCYDNHDTSLADAWQIPLLSAGWERPALNQDGLDYLTGKLGGVGFLSLRFSEDKVGGTKPALIESGGIRMADYTGTSFDPYLEVTYAAGGGDFNSRCSYSLGMVLR